LPIFAWPLRSGGFVTPSSLDFDFLAFLNLLAIVVFDFLSIVLVFRGWLLFRQPLSEILWRSHCAALALKEANQMPTA
jgi:hypothetical protein